MTSMFYSNGRVYYTLSNNNSKMYWRWFEPDSGIIGSDEFTITDAAHNWSHVAGAFLVGNTLYYADSTSHSLFSVPFVNGAASGTPVLADASINWASAGAFVLSTAMINDRAPVASYTLSCTDATRTCDVNGSASSDPDGTIATYSWSWGDTTTSQSASPTTQHVYTADGAYPVTLTVTDNDGVSSSVTHTAYIGVPPPAPVGFDAATSNYDKTGTNTVSVPASVNAGDALLLFETQASSTATDTVPSGWQLVGSTVKGSQTTKVYDKVAAPGDAGSTVTVTFSAAVKASITLASYTGTDQTNPIETFGTATATGATNDTAPGLTSLSDGTYVVSFWADKSSATTSFTPPAAVTQRALTFGVGTSTVNALLGDSGGAVSGSYGPQTATTNDASIASESWSIALAQAST
jgi:hypothetical protein